VGLGLKIRELRDGMSRVYVQGIIKAVKDIRNVRLRTGEEARVGDFILSDDSGEITLVLWNEDIDRVKEGDSVAVENGYTNTFRGTLRLNVGRYGRLVVGVEERP
jgi:replication factor A1